MNNFFEEETRLKIISIYKRERLIEIMDKQNQVTRRTFSTMHTSIWNIDEKNLGTFFEIKVISRKIGRFLTKGRI